MKKWFLTKLVFRIIVSGETKAQFDIQLRLLEAINLQDAFHLAKQIGFSEEEIFSSSKKKKVEWKFIDVESIQELVDLKSGLLLCATTQEEDVAEELIKNIKRKSLQLQEKFTDKFVPA